MVGTRARGAGRSVAAVAAVAALLGGLLVGGAVAVPSGVVSAAGSVPLSAGLDADGQLGNGAAGARTTPGAIAGPLATAGNVVQIASGREHAYALDDAGRVWGWGDGSKGAVGDGANTDRQSPVQLSLTNVVEVEAGHYHGIALRADGTVWTWGYGTIGQLGLGTTVNRNAPTQVPGLSGIVHVAAGRDMSYALAADGTMWGWGNNTYGEVGDGTTTRRVSPVRVQGIDRVVEIAGGRNHILVIRDDGSVWAWGANDYGQLGDGSTVSKSVPEQILAGPAAHVDAGADHSIVLMANGTVRTFGRSQRGQLGIGTTTTKTTPQTVPGLSGIVEIGDGRDQSFAMDAAGHVWAWGFNDNGQLGDGSTTNRLAPVQLAGLTGIVAAQGGRGHTVFLPTTGGGGNPDTTPPTAPGTPSGTSTVAGRADLTWAAASDDRAAALTYRVYMDGGATPVGTVTSASTGTVSFSQTGLVGGSTHTWHVTASDGTNTGPASGESAPVTIASGGGGGDVLLQTGFAGGLTGWTSVKGMTVDNATGSPGDGAPSARVAVSGAPGSAQRALASATTAACTAVDVRITSTGGTTKKSLLKLRSSSASFARVQIDGSRRLSVRADVPGTTLTLSSPRTLALGTWYRLRLCATVGTAGSLRLEVDGTVVGSWNVSTGTAPFARVQLGDNEARTITANWDALVVTAGAS